MKSTVLLALISGATSIKLQNKWVDDNGKVHPFFIPNDESTYEERYMAVERNIVKKTEGHATYGAHPTAPSGYAWNTSLPKEQNGTEPESKAGPSPSGNTTEET
jgi:hypothetical protein